MTDRLGHINEQRRQRDEERAHAAKAQADTRPRRITLDKATRRRILEARQTAVIRLPNPKPYRAGSLVQILPDEGGPAEFTCTITGTEWLSLEHAIPFADARRAKELGHRNPLAARRAFLCRHTSLRNLDDKQQAQIPDAQIHHAWARWQDRHCWLLHLKPLAVDRYFARGVQHETDQPETSATARGYTTNPSLAVEGEPAVVDDTWLAWFSMTAGDLAVAEVREAKQALPAPRNAAEARRLRQARHALNEIEKGRAA